MYLARSSPTVLTWFMDASLSGLQRPHSGTPRPPGASTPSRPLPAPARAPLGLPRLARLVRKPDRQAAAPAQALVVLAPVRDLALLLRDVVASVLVQLEGQGGHPGSDGGPPCYLDRAPGATRGIPATTCPRPESLGASLPLQEATAP